MADSLMPVTAPHTHPVHPTAAGLVPDAPIMRKQTYAAPLSYVGYTRRALAWVKRTGTNPVSAGLAWTAMVIATAAMWLVVLPIWYFVTLVIFGWFMVPFRLIRRSHRKQEHLQRQQLATMQAMMLQQQQAIAQSQRLR